MILSSNSDRTRLVHLQGLKKRKKQPYLRWGVTLLLAERFGDDWAVSDHWSEQGGWVDTGAETIREESELSRRGEKKGERILLVKEETESRE